MQHIAKTALFTTLMLLCGIFLNAQKLTLKQAIQIALEQFTDIKNANAALEKAALQLFMAQLFLQSSMQINSQYAVWDIINVQGKNSLDVTMSLSLPLLTQLTLNGSYSFDCPVSLGVSVTPFNSANEIRQLKLQYEKAQLQVERITFLVQQSVISNFIATQNASFSLVYSALQKSLAEENFAVAAIEYVRGFLSYLEYCNIQSAFFNAEQNYIKALND